MEVLFFLVPLALVLAGLVVAALVWAVRSGQFEDLEGPAHRILMDREGELEHTPGRDRPAPPARDLEGGDGGAGTPVS